MALSPPTVDPASAPALRAVMLVNVALTANPALADHTKAPPITVAWGVQIYRVADAEKARQVHLHCRVSDDNQKDQVSYSGQLTVVCNQHFPVNAALTEEQMDELAGWSSAALLVGYARTSVHAITALGPYPPVLVNLVNTSQLLQTATVVQPDGSARPLYSKVAKDVNDAEPVGKSAIRRSTKKRSKSH